MIWLSLGNRNIITYPFFATSTLLSSGVLHAPVNVISCVRLQSDNSQKTEPAVSELVFLISEIEYKCMLLC